MRFPGIGALVVGLGVLWVSLAQAQQVGFTQEDRERIDRRFDQVEKHMVRIETTLQMFMESTNRRFTEQREDINQRFEQVMLTLQMIAAMSSPRSSLRWLGYAWWDRRTIVRKAKEDTLETLERNAGAKEQALVEQAAAESIRRIEREGRLSDLILALRQHASTHPAFANDLKAFRLL